MSSRLYSYKTFKVSKMIALLNDEGYTLDVIAKSTGLSRRALSDWKVKKYRPCSRTRSDKLVEYAVRNLTSKELELCGVYP